jgi:UDP-N-acetylmuramoyl-tripeptide--D-alanyl-D-alanine ligase
MFAAFVGERADGHAFADAAVAAGAAAVLGSRRSGQPTVLVPDPRDALAALAHHVLGRLPDVTVLGVTGSQGKTSTKDLLAGVLADRADTVATRGSFNNELGLPLTVLRATSSTRFLLLEMGARGVGHLAELCAVARPDVAVVLNVGKAHIGEFGTQDDIARAKGELVEALPDDGTAVLNADDPRVLAMRERTGARVLTFGRAGGDVAADVVAGDAVLDELGRPSFRLHHGQDSAPVRLQLVGEHHVANATAAAAAALAVGADLAEVAESLGRVATLSRWRMEVTRRDDGVTVVNDAYNANPDSMAAALRALASLGVGSGGRRIAVVGEMKELGASTAAEHAEVGRLARSLGIDVLVAVGDVARVALGEAHREHGAGRGGEDDMGTTQAGATTGTVEVPAADNDAATRWLGTNLRPGDVVLVKASRGARLDEVADAVLQDGGHR